MAETRIPRPLVLAVACPHCEGDAPASRLDCLFCEGSGLICPVCREPSTVCDGDHPGEIDPSWSFEWGADLDEDPPAGLN